MPRYRPGLCPDGPRLPPARASPGRRALIEQYCALTTTQAMQIATAKTRLRFQRLPSRRASGDPLPNSVQTLETIGGVEGDRTPDLVIANDALSQLSYDPNAGRCGGSGRKSQAAARHPAATRLAPGFFLAEIPICFYPVCVRPAAFSIIPPPRHTPPAAGRCRPDCGRQTRCRLCPPAANTCRPGTRPAGNNPARGCRAGPSRRPDR